MKNRIELFLEDLTYNSKFEFLEESKNKDELQKIADKRGIKLPAHDLAAFKCTYAFVDRQNKNGCTLPKEEVEKALITLNNKAIDFDHFRKRVVGNWIDAKLVGDSIVAYGIFFKGNFPEDYATVKELFDKDVLAISFEAYGDRQYVGSGTDNYTLNDIEFAGGALLIKTSPAFPGSQVMEMANKERVLEFANIMKAPEQYVHSGEDKGLTEDAQYHVYDTQNIMRQLSEADCLNCKEKGYLDPQSIDFANNKAKVKCVNCQAEMSVDLTPACTLTKKGRKIKKMTSSFVASLENLEIYLETSGDEDEIFEMTIASLLEGEDFIDELGNEIIEDGSKLTDLKQSPECKKLSLEMDQMDALMKKTTDVNEKKKLMVKRMELEKRYKQLTKAKKLTYKERQNIKDDMFAVIKTVENKVTGKPRKIRMFPIQDPAHVRNALARLPQATETLKKLGVSPESVKSKILKRAKELNMTDLLKRNEKGGTMDELLKKYNKASVEELVVFLASEIETFKANLTSKEQDLTTAKTEKDTLTKDLNDAKAKLKVFEDEKAAVEAQKKADLVKARREELTEEFAKDLKDEDILNDLVFENAKLKKENASLKNTPVKGARTNLIKGSDDKGVKAEDASRKKIDQIAFGSVAVKEEGEE